MNMAKKVKENRSKERTKAETNFMGGDFLRTESPGHIKDGDCIINLW